MLAALRERKYHRLYLAFGIILVLLTAALCIFLRPAADDFFYVTFLDNGVSGFIAKTVEHYRTMTGRVFVHLVLCPLLAFNMWPFRLFNVLLLCGLCTLAMLLSAPRAGDHLPAFIASMGLFWLAGIGTLSDGALWGAGSLNYLFPVTLVLLYYYMLQNRLSRGASAAWLCIPAVFCASTVEMTGLLVPLTVVFLAATGRRSAKKQPFAVALNLCGALAGYLFLFTSGGVAARLETNGYTSVGFLWRLEINYALFDRMICGPEGIWLIVTLSLLSAAYVLRRKAAKAAFAVSGLLTALTGTGTVYSGPPLAAIALIAFLMLCIYSIWAYAAGERLIPFCMLCTAVSLSVCMVSPVSGPRMVLPSAVFLSLLCVRGLFWKGVPERAFAYLLSGTTALAAITLGFYIAHFSDNAKVIDQNTSATLQARDSGAESLRLYAVPDEFYGGTTVPSNESWGGSFREHYHLGDIMLEYEDPSAAPIVFDGEQLTRPAVCRGGQYYVPIRIAADVCGADIDWELACAVARVDGKVFCLHGGSHVANLGHGIAPSVRLRDPIRSINSSIYISLRDFEMLFGVVPALSVGGGSGSP